MSGGVVLRCSCGSDQPPERVDFIDYAGHVCNECARNKLSPESYYDWSGIEDSDDDN